MPLRPRPLRLRHPKPELARNRIEIDGLIAGHTGLRHTPAGLPTLQFRLEHASEQSEGGRQRRVACQLEALAFGPPAPELAGLQNGTRIRLIGFLERKGAREPWPIVHVIEYELI